MRSTGRELKPYLKSMAPCPKTRSVFLSREVVITYYVCSVFFDVLCGTCQLPGMGSLMRTSLTLARSMVPPSLLYEVGSTVLPATG